MSKNEHEVESDLIDLGDVAIETKGSAPYHAPDGTINQLFNVPPMAAD